MCGAKPSEGTVGVVLDVWYWQIIISGDSQYFYIEDKWIKVLLYKSLIDKGIEHKTKWLRDPSMY